MTISDENFLDNCLINSFTADFVPVKTNVPGIADIKSIHELLMFALCQYF